ncbi:MAG: glycosyltransferase family 4 protein [Kiritimatiellae bacterium]|nr:glycosyltransferase family 4 protein [Kiritimatiellia bacterium]MDW8458384.1 glycosyltransferase family 4 protein [Verrucomicrobiota bacterium]
MNGQQGREPSVCLLTGSFFPRVGGGETHARLLARELLALGTPVWVLTRRHERTLPAIDEVDGVRVRRIGPSGAPRWGKYLMLPGAIATLIRERNHFDVIYVCGLRVLGLAGVIAALLLRKRVILRSEACGEWSGAFLFAGAAVPRKLPWPARLAIGARNALYLRADRFLAISRVIEQEYIEGGIPPAKILRIPNGIEFRNFTPPAPQERETLRKTLGVENKFVFAYSGKLNRGKGLERLLRVFGELAAQYPQIHLLLIGAGGSQFLSCEEELRRFTAEHKLEPRVTFTGYTDRVADYLKASDAFVFPSESEAHPLALIEAMACGLPAFASNVGGIPDIITDGKDGRLLPPYDEAAWRTAMADALLQPEASRRLGLAAAESVRARYAIREIARQHQEAFRSLINRG